MSKSSAAAQRNRLRGLGQSSPGIAAAPEPPHFIYEDSGGRQSRVEFTLIDNYPLPPRRAFGGRS